MEYSRPVGIPMTNGHKISKNDDFAEENKTLYRSMIIKLQYVVHKKLDIALAVEIVTRFYSSPKEIHMMEIKNILRYLKGT